MRLEAAGLQSWETPPGRVLIPLQRCDRIPSQGPGVKSWLAGVVPWDKAFPSVRPLFHFSNQAESWCSNRLKDENKNINRLRLKTVSISSILSLFSLPFCTLLYPKHLFFYISSPKKDRQGGSLFNIFLLLVLPLVSSLVALHYYTLSLIVSFDLHLTGVI